MAIDNKYKGSDRLSDLIDDNFKLLMVMSRFGISLGFGEKTVEEVCNSENVDCNTFLAVANFISSEQASFSVEEQPQLSIHSLMDYLKNAHVYFLDFVLPMLRRKLIEAIDCSREDNVAFLILKFFDEFVNEVREHMQYENEQVFVYVDSLLEGKLSSKFNIAKFATHHSKIDERLKELKGIITKYYNESSDNMLLSATLFDIYSCEQDLASHNLVEDCLFVPAVMHVEKELRNE
ncbi:MAG: hemerythrin domain-containing protein [Muribaculaceae bacterium]|nr:hemerythrin domain-containing protein [Muribaculaceae bacterium]